jgi:hypothetical protein
MTPEQVLSHPPDILTSRQRESFFAEGYLCLPEFVPRALLTRLEAASDAAVERTRSLVASNMDFSLDPDHTPEIPRPSRLYRASDEDPSFWEYASSPPLVDLAADLVGPDVRYREAYVNYKCARSAMTVHWHQDLAFFPHTNRSVITTITYTEDVTPEMGPLMVVPESHSGEVFDHYDGSGEFKGRICEADLARLPLERALSLPGPAGTVIVIDGSMVHGSDLNRSDSLRPVLIIGYSAADAFPYTEMSPQHSDRHIWQIVRGRRPLYAHHEPIRVKVPPAWTKEDFEPIFNMQRDSDPRDGG